MKKKLLKHLFILTIIFSLFKIIVVNANTNAPVIIGAKDITIEWTYDIPNWLKGITAKDYDGTDLTNKIVVEGKVNTTDVGTYPLTYKVTNDLGITSTQTVNVVVKNTHAPSLFNTGSLEIEVNTKAVDWKTKITVKDDYDAHHGLKTPELQYDESNFDLTKVGVYNVPVWAINSCGVKAAKILQVSVVDTTAPVIEEINQLEIGLNSTNINYLYGLNISDNYTKLADLKININDFNVDLTFPGYYEVIYTVIDENGNVSEFIRTVKVVDNVPPQIIGNDEITINIGNDVFIISDYYTVIDDFDSYLINLYISLKGTLDKSKAGVYYVTLVVSDSSGNETTKDIKITVIDNIKPEIKNIRDQKVKVNSNFDPLSGVTGIDNNDGDITNKIKVSGEYNLKKAGIYTITLTLQDEALNETVETFVLTVEGNNNFVSTIIAASLGVALIGLGAFIYIKKR